MAYLTEPTPVRSPLGIALACGLWSTFATAAMITLTSIGMLPALTWQASLMVCIVTGAFGGVIGWAAFGAMTPEAPPPARWARWCGAVIVGAAAYALFYRLVGTVVAPVVEPHHRDPAVISAYFVGLAGWGIGWYYAAYALALIGRQLDRLADRPQAPAGPPPDHPDHIR